MMIVDIAVSDPANTFAPYQRMANAIAELMHRNGGCLPQDLLHLGFTKEETLDHWRMAYSMAMVECKILNRT